MYIDTVANLRSVLFSEQCDYSGSCRCVLCRRSKSSFTLNVGKQITRDEAKQKIY